MVQAPQYGPEGIGDRLPVPGLPDEHLAMFPTVPRLKPEIVGDEGVGVSRTLRVVPAGRVVIRASDLIVVLHGT